MRQYAQEIGDRFVAALARSYGDAYTFLRTRSNVARWSPEHIVVLRDRVEHAYQEGRITAETMEKACQLISSLVGDYDDPKTDEIAPARRRPATAQARAVPTAAAITTTVMTASASCAVSRGRARPAPRHPVLTLDAEARDAAIQTMLLSEPVTASPPATSAPAAPPIAASNATPASPSKVVAGALLAQRYVLEKLIGIGGTSLVYQARDLKAVGARAAKRLAVKLLHPTLQVQPSAVERFIDQFQQQQKLSHAGIARVFDLDVDAGSWFMTMELLEGATLLDRARGGLPRSEALRLVAACGDALIYAHQCGVVHGDLKPSNIFLTESGAVRLLDFGGSVAPRVADAAGDSTGEAAAEVSDVRIAATPAYASPEVLAGERPCARDDIFSLACIAHELLTGEQRPRDGARAGRTVSAGLSLRDSLALSRGMAWHRMDRPQSMAEFLRLLFAPQPTDTVPTVSHASETAAASLGKRWQRHGRLLGFGLWGVGCLVALLSFAFGDPEAPNAGDVSNKAVAVVTAPQAAPTAVAAEPASAVITPATTSPASRSSTNSPSAAPSALTPSADVPPSTVPPFEAPAATTSRAPAEPALAPRSAQEPAPRTTVTARRAATDRVPVSTPASTRAAAGSIGLERRQVLVSGRAVAAVITLKRIGSTNGRARVRWSTVPGTAKSAQHFRSASAVAEFADGQEIRTLFVPIVQQASNPSARTFSVALERAPGGPPVGPVTKTTVTILGDI